MTRHIGVLDLNHRMEGKRAAKDGRRWLTWESARGLPDPDWHVRFLDKAHRNSNDDQFRKTALHHSALSTILVPVFLISIPLSISSIGPLEPLKSPPY